jgi:hypothetical protein
MRKDAFLKPPLRKGGQIMRNKLTMLPFVLQRLRRLTPIVSTAVFAACMGLAPGARADVVYNYVFSPGAGYAGNGDSANLSGTFSWDATTGSVVTSNIDLSGFDATGTSPGPVSCSNCTTGIYDTSGGLYFAVNLGPQALYTIYTNSLSLGANDPLALSAGANGAEYQGGLPFTSVTGSANIVPEPSTWAMMLIGFAGLGLAGYRTSRKSAAIAA